ncbi:hypothetical protein AB0G02_00825 [Actinosynnema sp. NPDC023658]|uniref:hypothetical protein n=1 Tax=Actinosynnema sp. NPDC023658 TaxID=3155465 RepID=UPI0033DE3968
MSEADLREALRAAVVDEPPLDFDPDRLIRRGRHVRRRRALVAAVVATLVLTGTVLSLPGVLDRRPRHDVAAEAGVDAGRGPVLTTAAPTPPTVVGTVPPSPPVAATPGSEGLRAYLEHHLGERFTEVVPDAKVTQVEFAVHPENEAGRITGWLTFVDAEGAGQVVVQLSPPPATSTLEEFCATVTCDESRLLADGSYAASSDVHGTGKAITRTVVHFRADGSVVQVTGYNYDPATAAGPRAEVALTVDELVALATDPGLAP